MKSGFDNNLAFRVMRFGIEKETFSLLSLKNEGKFREDEIFTVFSMFLAVNSAMVNDHILVTTVNFNENQKDLSRLWDMPCRLTTNAIFQYVDYLEIVEARKSAADAKRLSWIAIGIAVVLGIVQTALQVIQTFKY